MERLNGRSSIEAYEGAKEILQKDNPHMLRSVIDILLHGRKPLNRAAAAYALSLNGKAAILALERSVGNKREHPKVRGQAAESLAYNHRAKSHHILQANLNDLSKEVRFWCAYSLAQMDEEDALVPLRKLAERDHRTVKGLWSVSKEANWAIREIRKEIKKRQRRRKLFCPFCLKTRQKQPY